MFIATVAAGDQRAGCLVGFATQCSIVDKFERCEWHPGPGGAPVLKACGNWFAGRILERIPTGDHCAMLIEPFQAASVQGEEPFTFHRARR